MRTALLCFVILLNTAASLPEHLPFKYFHSRKLPKEIRVYWEVTEHHDSNLPIFVERSFDKKTWEVIPFNNENFRIAQGVYTLIDGFYDTTYRGEVFYRLKWSKKLLGQGTQVSYLTKEKVEMD